MKLSFTSIKNLIKDTLSRLIPWFKSWLPVWLIVSIRKVYQYFRTIHIRKYVKMHQARLNEILTLHKNGNPLIIFAPSLDWNVQLFQRPQQLALALAREGALVFYPQPQADLHQPPFVEIAERLYLCNVFVETFSSLESPYVYVLTWNTGHLVNFKSPRIIYDYLDDINVFWGNHAEISIGHARMLSDAQIIVTTAVKLYDEVIQTRKDVLLIPNGVDFVHFDKIYDDNSPVIPEDFKPIVALKRPIIGYYGALARWFDYDLLYKVALLKPEYSFVLIGPDYDGTLLQTGLSKYPNIFWLGVKTYQELPNYLHLFDVATIPFIVNDITNATSPLKLFEYMAGKKPVVVTPMQESMRYPGVLVGNGPEEFADQIDRAIEMRFDPSYQLILQNVVKENTWEKRAQYLISCLLNSTES